jgi:hypothetical protein
LTGTTYLSTQLHRSLSLVCELRVKFPILSSLNGAGAPIGVIHLNLGDLDVLSLDFKPEAWG